MRPKFIMLITVPEARDISRELNNETKATDLILFRRRSVVALMLNCRLP